VLYVTLQAWPPGLYCCGHLLEPKFPSLNNMEFEMRKFVAALVGVATLATALPAGAGSLQSRPAPDLQNVYPGESYSQYYYRRGSYYGPRYYHGPRYYRGGGGGAVAAGVVGLAAGALIAGAIASQAQAAPPPPPGVVSPSVAAYCARKYRSYDPASGTFLAHDGMRYVCTYP
jgi:hypothetical protein